VLRCQSLENVVDKITSCRKGGFNLIFEAVPHVPYSLPPSPGWIHVCPASTTAAELWFLLRERRKSTEMLFEQGSLLPRVMAVWGWPVTPAPGGHGQRGCELPPVGRSLLTHLDGTGTATTHPSSVAWVPGCIATPTEHTELRMGLGCPRAPGERSRHGGCGDAAARQPGQDAWLRADSLCGLREVNDPRFAHLERGCNEPSLLCRVCQLSLRAQAPSQDRQIRYEAR